LRIQPITLAAFIGVGFVAALVTKTIRSVETTKVVKVEKTLE
jgi:hypothetical protein